MHSRVQSKPFRNAAEAIRTRFVTKLLLRYNLPINVFVKQAMANRECLEPTHRSVSGVNQLD